MPKHFRIVAGRKFYCDEKGVLAKEDGHFKEVDAEDTTAVEVEESDDATEEVAKMLSDAVAQVTAEVTKTSGESQVKALEAVDALMKGIAASAGGAAKKAVSAVAKASYDVEATLKGMADVAEKQRDAFTFTVTSKADLDFLVKTTSEGGSLTDDVIEPQRTDTLERDPVRQVFIESICTSVPNMTSDNLSYVETTNESGAPLPTAELNATPAKDFEFTEFKAPLKKIGVHNKHSVEILKDAPQLVAAIKGWLNEDVNIVTDDQLLNGDGTGNNLLGVFSLASTLDVAAVGAKRVADANLYDVIRVAITKAAVAGKGKFMVNYVLLNPDDADALDLTKDANGQYVLPPFRSADGMTIKGARVIENTGIPAGEFLVGDFRKMVVGTQGGVDVTMTNSDAEDFTKGIITVNMTRRVASYVKTNNNGAFWTGDIAAVIAALTA